MYRIAIFLYPDGKFETNLQSSEKNGPSIDALAFLYRTKLQIQEFKKAIHQSIVERRGINKVAPGEKEENITVAK